MVSSRFTLTQYLDFVKPLFINSMASLELHQEKMVDRPTKIMSRQDENIPAMTVGHLVDILTRAQLLASPDNPFPLRTALYQSNRGAQQLDSNIALRKENSLLSGISELGWNAVVNLSAVLHGLRCWRIANPPRHIRPNRKTVNNILHMVDISVTHLQGMPNLTMGDKLGGDRFPKLYPTKIDYTTETGLWDMIVSEHEPRPTQILKLMAYDILAFYTPVFKDREFMEVGILNPRLEYRYWLSCKRFPVDEYDILQQLLRVDPADTPE